VFVAFFYYVSQRELLFQEKRETLSTLTNEHIANLKNLHNTFDKQQTYPRDPRYESAIFDSALKEIFSTLGTKRVNLYEDIYLHDGKMYFVKELEFYYLGARYTVLEIPAPTDWAKKVYQKLFLYGSVIFLVLVAIGYFLLLLLLQPMRQAISLLDRFIKDTTHELNTPVNAILSNIEMIECETLDASLAKKIKRITIASKTISNLYDDLTYLVLSHRTHSQNEVVDLKALVEERMEYFHLLMESKKITQSLVLQENVTLFCDKKKITKIIDNILSNAIKYNIIGGSITVSLIPQSLSIEDTGIGIEESKLHRVFERYTRFDTTVGGFGIGLSIVSLIAKEYGLHVMLDSALKKGTKVTITW
jgi:two-component system OmpR family sensor kinase